MGIFGWGVVENLTWYNNGPTNGCCNPPGICCPARRTTFPELNRFKSAGVNEILPVDEDDAEDVQDEETTGFDDGLFCEDAVIVILLWEDFWPGGGIGGGFGVFEGCSESWAGDSPPLLSPELSATDISSSCKKIRFIINMNRINYKLSVIIFGARQVFNVTHESKNAQDG